MTAFDRNKLPKLSKAQQRALTARTTQADIVYDTVDAINTLTHIMIGALIEPGRDREQWARARIRDLQAGRIPQRYRTYEILRNAQLKSSAFDWLQFYLDKWELTKATDGKGHLHDGRIIEVDYEMTVVSNV